jgi:hypothetical protein
MKNMLNKLTIPVMALLLVSAFPLTASAGKCGEKAADKAEGCASRKCAISKCGADKCEAGKSKAAQCEAKKGGAEKGESAKGCNVAPCVGDKAAD